MQFANNINMSDFGKKHVGIIAVLVTIFAVVPFGAFLGLALSEPICWDDTWLPSDTWLIVFAVDMLVCLSLPLALFYKNCFKTYRSGHSIHWSWSSALILLFDIVWLAFVSSQISKLGLTECNSGTVIAAMVILCLKILWTSCSLLMIMMGG